MPPDPALTGEFGPQPSVNDQRRAILPEARRLLDNPELARAYAEFRDSAIALAGAGMVFEMVHRPDPASGGLAPREPRNLSIATVPEKALGEAGETVVLMGVGFWEFLPGYFFGSDRIIDGRRMAMDVGSFRFTENTPSGDAEIVGQSEAGPMAQYMRIDISGDGLVKSLAVSNAALGGAFVAAYRHYVEVLAGYPYKMLHPYRQLSLPTPPPLLPGAAAPQAARARPMAPPPLSPPHRSRAAWLWLAVPPLIGLAFYLGSLTSLHTPEDTPAGFRPPPPESLRPGDPSGAAMLAPPPALPSLPEVALQTPPSPEEADGLPLPPPPAPPPPERESPTSTATAEPPLVLAPGPRNLALPGTELHAGGGAAVPRLAVVAQAANLRAAAFGGSPVIRVVPGGTPVRILEERQGWLRVAAEDGEVLGWIYNSLIR